MTEPLAKAPFTITNGLQRHAAYAELAATAPIHRIVLPTGKLAWLITGYYEARQALQDPRMVKSDATRILAPDLAPSEVVAAAGSHMLNCNPPDHTRLRRLVSAVFTRRRVEQLAPRIQQIADELLDSMADKVQVDLIASFALPLPSTVICELLGVPVDHCNKVHDWSATFVTGMLAGRAELVAAAIAMMRYLRKLVEAKRAAPADDLLSTLVALRDGDDRLSEDELTSMAFLILVAGRETTADLIGNGMLALLTHLEQLALLHAEPERLPAAIEELLRYDPPLQAATSRVTTHPVEIGAITVPTGEIVLAGVLAANRDAACTMEPHALDVTRTNNPHLTFGYGIHHCLGAPLARLEGRIALSSLLARFPRLRLAVPPDQLTSRPGVLTNGLDKLPVILR